MSNVISKEGQCVVPYVYMYSIFASLERYRFMLIISLAFIIYNSCILCMFIYFKNTKNLFIHIAHYPVRRFLRDIPTF